MPFDWIRFFDAYGIPYVTRGANISRGDVGLRCPWCGEDDPSEHMGVSLAGKGFSCWRSKNHSGSRPQKLIMALLNCSRDEANRIVGTDITPPLSSDEEFVQQVAGALVASPSPTPPRKPLRPTADMRLLTGAGMGRLFISYLARRGYPYREALGVAARYGLMYATEGPFQYRLIIPVYDEEGRLATWTGRTIQRLEVIRYKTLSENPERAKHTGLPLARRNIKHLLWNLPTLMAGGDTLVVCEGPLDAIRVDWLGGGGGVDGGSICGTCMFGKFLSEEQLLLLDGLSTKFRRKLLILDHDAGVDQVSILDALSCLGFRAIYLPRDVKDPAELRTDQFRAIVTAS